MQNQERLEVEISNQCDKEPIHLFNSIQGHGFLLGFTWPDQRVQIISDNAKQMINKERQEVLGSKLEHVFESDFVKFISDVVKLYPWPTNGKHLSLKANIEGKIFDAFLFNSEGLFILELEEYFPSYDGFYDEVESQEILREFTISARNITSIEELSKLVCVTFRRVTGLDRVMMYRFIPPSWHGEVIAEDRVTTAHSYMSHRFPATDIPAPARELYLRNQVRLIPNIQVPTVGLNPRVNPKTNRLLDLSDSRLRAAAPIHLEYLKNMGVTASFSVAVTDQKDLWGLVTCHHLKPIVISQAKRTVCEIIAQIFSMQAPLIERNVYQDELIEFEFKLKKILESLRLSPDPLDHFFKQHRTITETFNATGIALVSSGLNDFAGLTPLKPDIEELSLWIRKKMVQDKKLVIAIDNLTALDPVWARVKDYASGVLAILMPELNDSLLLIFRPEFVRTIAWGGDPRKQLDKRKFQGDLHPRNSFETWQETISNQSRPWSKYEVEGISFLRDFVFDGLVRHERTIKELRARGSN